MGLPRPELPERFPILRLVNRELAVGVVVTGGSKGGNEVSDVSSVVLTISPTPPVVALDVFGVVAVDPSPPPLAGGIGDGPPSFGDPYDGSTSPKSNNSSPFSFGNGGLGTVIVSNSSNKIRMAETIALRTRITKNTGNGFFSATGFANHQIASNVKKVDANGVGEIYARVEVPCSGIPRLVKILPKGNYTGTDANAKDVMKYFLSRSKFIKN